MERKEGNWQPKLGDKFLGHASHDGPLEQRFKQAGFSLELTQQEQQPFRQSSRKRGDKNDEGLRSRDFGTEKGDTNMNTDQQAQVGSTPTPAHLADQVAALRAAGASIGIPINIQLDEKALSALVGKSPTMGQELARFSAKAGVCALVALGTGLAYRWLTSGPVDEL